jgi:hypothetical protein
VTIVAMARPVAKQKSSPAKAKPAAAPKKATKTAAKPTPRPAKASKVVAKPKPAPAASRKAASPVAPPAKPIVAAPRRASTALPASRKVDAPAPAPAAAPPAPARFAFTAVPIVRDAAGLTPLLRAQLVVDAQVRTGRVTTPERIPTSYFSPGVVRWRVSEGKKPAFDVVHDTAFFPDSAEPVGLERIAGVWQATGRGSDRGRALDLPRIAWELMRDWPGRRLPLGPEPRPGARWKPLPPVETQPWPADATFA